MNLSLLMAVSNQLHFNLFTIHTCYMIESMITNYEYYFHVFLVKNTFIHRENEEFSLKKSEKRWAKMVVRIVSHTFQRNRNYEEKRIISANKHVLSHVCVLPIKFSMHKTKIMFKWKKENARTHTGHCTMVDIRKFDIHLYLIDHQSQHFAIPNSKN